MIRDKKKEEEELGNKSIPLTNEILTLNYSFQVYKIYIAWIISFCCKKRLLSILLRIFLFQGDFFGLYKELTYKQRLTLLGSRLSERLRNSTTAIEEFN